MSSSMVTAFHAHPGQVGGTEEAQRTSDPNVPEVSVVTTGRGGCYPWKGRQNAVGRGRDGILQHFLIETEAESNSPTYGTAKGASGHRKRPAPSGGSQDGQEDVKFPDRGAARARMSSDVDVRDAGEKACGVSFDTWYAEGLTGKEEIEVVD